MLGIRRYLLDTKRTQNHRGIGLALGLAIGIILGTAFGNIALGIIFGVTFGLIFSGKKQSAKENSSPTEDRHDA